MRRALWNLSKFAAAGLLLLNLAALTAPATGRTAVSSPQDCAPENELQAICGPVGTEDLVDIKGTRWLIGSGLNLGKPAQLVLIDSRRKSWSPLTLAASGPVMRGSDCNAPPTPSEMSFSGLAVGQDRKDRLLYAVNHGDRRAIEVFRIEQPATHPRLAWIGCALLPPHTMPNAVVALPDGTLVVSSFFDPDDDDAWNRMERGEDGGRLLEWHPGKAFKSLDVPNLSGPNGLEASGDGGTLYVSAWASRKIVVLDRAQGTRHDIPLDFMPDNLRRLSDSRLLVAGQRSSPASIARCRGPQCPQPWVVAVVDPRGQSRPLIAHEGTERVNYACTALLKDGVLFITVRGMDRIMFGPPPNDIR